MNIQSLQEAIRERDEARDQLDLTVNTLRLTEMARVDTVAQLSEAVALLRRLMSTSAQNITAKGDAIGTFMDTRAFLARIDKEGA